MDVRGFRVALISDDLVNPGSTGIDGLSVLEAEGWGAVHLPPNAYPREISAPLLEHIAEQAEEFLRNGYDLVLIGHREGVQDALSAVGIPSLPMLRPSSTDEIQAFLRRRPPPPARKEPSTSQSPRQATSSS
ncbi:MAG: hypothetical protein ACRDQ2_16045 [Gaiellales bacterium]